MKLVAVTLNPSIDHTIFVDRITIGDTNRALRVERDAGGKGVNLARVYAELGGEVLATGFLGGGPGANVREVLGRQGVESNFIEVKGDTRLNVTVEQTSGGPPTAFSEVGPTVTRDEWSQLLELIESEVQGAAWMSVGGSLPPGVPANAYETLVELGNRWGCEVALDADGQALKEGLKAFPTFIKPNDREAARLLGKTVETEEEAIAAARSILSMIESGSSSEAFRPLVVVSRGARGAVLATRDEVYRGVPPEIVPKSTIGSGDSLIAGMLWGFSRDLPMAEAFQWGIAAGTATAETDGSEIARRPVIDRLFPQVVVERL